MSHHVVLVGEVLLLPLLLLQQGAEERRALQDVRAVTVARRRLALPDDPRLILGDAQSRALIKSKTGEQKHTSPTDCILTCV